VSLSLTKSEPSTRNTYGGYLPSQVFAPASEEACVDIVRQACAEALPLVCLGGGTTIDDTLRPLASRFATVELRGLRNTLEVRTADSLVTVAAGLPFAEVQRALQAENQQLTMDPPVAESATVGGVVAANAYGLRRAFSGPVADSVVAVRVITGTGEVIRAGAPVVKNAAGYDLCRLISGSRGALAIVTEVTLRIAPRPAYQVQMAFAFGSLSDAIQTTWALAEEVACLDYVALGGGLFPDAPLLLLCSTSGTRRHVARVHQQVRSCLKGTAEELAIPCMAQAEETARQALHGCGFTAAVRWCVPRAMAAGLLPDLAAVSERWVWLAPVGIISAAAYRDGVDAFVGAIRHRHLGDGQLGALRWLRLPADYRRDSGKTRPATSEMVRRLKAVFDPHGILWPGLLEGEC